MRSLVTSLAAYCKPLFYSSSLANGTQWECKITLAFYHKCGNKLGRRGGRRVQLSLSSFALLCWKIDCHSWVFLFFSLYFNWLCAIKSVLTICSHIARPSLRSFVCSLSFISSRWIHYSSNWVCPPCYCLSSFFLPFPALRTSQGRCVFT